MSMGCPPQGVDASIAGRGTASNRSESSPCNVRSGDRMQIQGDQSMRTLAAAPLALAVTVVLAFAVSQAVRADDDATSILTIDHHVPHLSTVPALTGQTVQLYVRERALAVSNSSLPGNGRIVLFVHGATYPSAHGF